MYIFKDKVFWVLLLSLIALIIVFVISVSRLPEDQRKAAATAFVGGAAVGRLITK